jgi:N-acetylglutamate synthase-like GNAT family acetyltransferase
MRAIVALTFHPEYFERPGFRRVSPEHVPSAVWQCYSEPDKRLAGSESALRYELGGAWG